MDKIEIPQFGSRKELQKFLVENKQTLIAQKKSILKHADGMIYGTPVVNLQVKGKSFKAGAIDVEEVDQIKVSVAINSTNWLDSHMDVHLKGLWNKSLKENKNIMFLQEHQYNRFDKIIADGDDLEASVKTMNWKELGFDASGTTEVLKFAANILKARNPYMFDQYAKGYVKNHSVGMRYVQLVLAINDEDYGAEYEAWEKYFPEIVNSEVAEEKGFFWAVKEAKIIEGSAVPIGSNVMTPTISVGKDIEPSEDTQEQEAAKKALQQKQFYSNLI